MVPVIAANGASFRGAFQYYCHDKRGRTTERVEWTQTVNMLTDCVTKAWKVMAYTARHQDRLKDVSGEKATGAKTRKPVFAFSLSWAPEQRPDKKMMLDAARQSLAALGLSDHQAIIVAHNDRPHRHVHVVANTIHPLTGLVAKLKYTKRKLSDFALQYEQEHGKIYCKQREENHRQRADGQPTRYRDPHIVEAWESTTSGSAFIAALESKGYRLAQGRKRLVIIDPHGKAHNPTRHLQGVKAEDFRVRVADLDLNRLPDAEAQVQPAHPAPAEKTKSPQEALERRSQEQREQLEETHRLACAQLEAQHARRLDLTKKRLMNFYDLRGKKKDLHAIGDRLRKTSWWKKLLGLTRKQQKLFDEQRLAYRTAVHSCREKIQHARLQAQQELAELHGRQAGERERLQRAFEKERQQQELTAQPVRTPERFSHGMTEEFCSQADQNRLEGRENRSELRMSGSSSAYLPRIHDDHARDRSKAYPGRDGGRSL